MYVIHQVRGKYENLDTKSEAWGVQILLFADNEVYNP